MMQIIIDIPEEYYNAIKALSDSECVVDTLIIKYGKVLPKGHGRLIDADRLKTHFVGTEQGTDLEVYLESTIIDAPTIIEADKAESENKE